MPRNKKEEIATLQWAAAMIQCSAAVDDDDGDESNNGDGGEERMQMLLADDENTATHSTAALPTMQCSACMSPLLTLMTDR